jgi:hypothetical protein
MHSICDPDYFCLLSYTIKAINQSGHFFVKHFLSVNQLCVKNYISFFLSRSVSHKVCLFCDDRFSCIN